MRDPPQAPAIALLPAKVLYLDGTGGRRWIQLDQPEVIQRELDVS